MIFYNYLIVIQIQATKYKITAKNIMVDIGLLNFMTPSVLNDDGSFLLICLSFKL